MPNTRYFLALNRITGLTKDDISIVIDHHEHLEEIFNEKYCQLFSETVRQQIGKINWADIDIEFKWLEQPNHHVMTILDEAYPSLLREISSPPLLLYIKGDLSILKKPQIAIVGSRNPTPMGYKTAKEFASFLAGQGLVITSGLAMGIDAASHEGALINGKTVAVLGTGIDQTYPKRNNNLADSIVAQGALVSEFPLSTAPCQFNFPRRNRIISGLSLGVLVVEAALRSGSLITAKFALEQNREVFAIPGSIHNPLSKGCHYLIKSGAKLVENAEDILIELQETAHLNIELNKDMKKNVKKTDEKLDFFELGVEYRNILSCIGFESTAIDTMISLCSYSPEILSSMLLKLELQGFLARVPGGYLRLK